MNRNTVIPQGIERRKVREVRKANLYLAAVTLGAFLAVSGMPLTAQAASLSPNAGGTIIDDTDVPLDGGSAGGGETSIEEGEVPLASAEKTTSTARKVAAGCGGAAVIGLGLFGAKATGLLGGAKAVGAAGTAAKGASATKAAGAGARKFRWGGKKKK